MKEKTMLSLLPLPLPPSLSLSLSLSFSLFLSRISIILTCSSELLWGKSAHIHSWLNILRKFCYLFITITLFFMIQIYQPLDIYIVLVGLEVWMSGDMITILTSNSDQTLDNFYNYSQTYINVSRDDTQFIT